jgi:benzoyl-CoA reductase subunit BamC
MKKKVKVIKIDLDKCMGCRACEVACAAFHASPRYSTVNPERSRIRVFRNELKNVFVPVKASFYTKAECAGRHVYAVGEKEQSAYGDGISVCSFCGAACPSRDLFKEPDSGLPLKCDMCEDEPPLEEPMCVKWCLVDALTYEEREEDVEEEVEVSEMEIAIQSLLDRYGTDKVVDAIARMAAKE